MLHSWDITPSEGIELQKRLWGLVREEALVIPVETVAGADCAFARGGREILATAVLCDARTFAVVATASVRRPCTFPYVPGLLSFREAPSVIEAVEKLPRRPDLLMVDGHGRAHPRRFGIACHVGLWLDLPTIGVAKSRLCGEHREPGRRRGCRVRLLLDGQVVGSVVRTRHAVRPAYVSVGHRITLAEAVRWVLRAARVARLPEPTRQADHLVGRLKRQLGAV